jgi:hypothetical protein
MQIITNNVPRDIVEAYELTKAEQAEFDFIDWTDVDNGNASPEFFRYRGQLYYLESEGRPSFAPGWDGYLSDSFFSGILFRFPVEDGRPDYERIIVGTYIA